MADQFLAEIRLVPFNFAPTSWAFCNGQVIPIAQNTALFALLGTTYGGDGKSTYCLPNLSGCMPMHPGQGPGLSNHDLGEIGGTETVTLLSTEMPAHSHALNGSTDPSRTSSPALGVFGPSPDLPFHPGGADTPLAPNALSVVGGGQAHNNMPPYLAMNFVIALQGIFPQRP
jgi:microcystin-dependent protein